MFLADWRTPTILDRYAVFMDYFTERSQHVRVCDGLSGVPQGCVLSPLLFVPDSNKCHHLSHMVKFADDAVMNSLLSSGGTERSSAVTDFIERCCSSSLKISVSTTKEMIIDFRRNPVVLRVDKPAGCVTSWVWWLMIGWPLGGCSVQESSPKDLGGKLWVFNMDGTFMWMFYSCFLESILTFSLICWSLKDYRMWLRGAAKLQTLPRMTSPLYISPRCWTKQKSILSQLSHPLLKEFRLPLAFLIDDLCLWFWWLESLSSWLFLGVAVCTWWLNVEWWL